MVLMPISVPNNRKHKREIKMDTTLIPDDVIFNDNGNIVYEGEETEEDVKMKKLDKSMRILGDKTDLEGLPLDGYDYSKHLKFIGDGDVAGVVLGPDGMPIDKESDITVKL